MPPGGEGKITIEVKTDGSGGKKLKKTISVFTNDINNTIIPLTIAGNVEKFATITPPKLRLSGVAGQALSREIRIIPEKKYPFKILDITTKKNSDIKFTLNEVAVSKRTEYLLTVQNLKKNQGKYHHTIKIKTNSQIKPEIKIHVIGNIR